MRRGALQGAVKQPVVLGFGQPGGCIARPVGERRDGIGLETTLALEHAESDRTGAGVAHEPRRRGLAAQRVVYEPGDRRAIPRPGETVREAPILERIGRGPPTLLDVAENLDRCGQAGGGGHPSPSRMRNAKMIHIASSTSALARYA